MTAGPDVVRGSGPYHSPGLDTLDPKRVLPINRSTASHHAIITLAIPLSRAGGASQAVRPARPRVGGQHRTPSGQIRHALVTSHEGSADLPADSKLRAVQLLLGNPKIESIVRYLGIEVNGAIEITEKIDM
jgi:hypothetical protein